MSYINQITVGGETYNLAPSFNGAIGAYLEFESKPVLPFGVYDTGELYLNLALVYENMYGIRVPYRGVTWGLGADVNGAIGVYLYTGSTSVPTININDTVSRLARLGLTSNGAIGVYLTTKDGLGTQKDGCLTLLYDTTPVTLLSGEILSIGLNAEGRLQLTRTYNV